VSVIICVLEVDVEFHVLRSVPECSTIIPPPSPHTASVNKLGLDKRVKGWTH